MGHPQSAETRAKISATMMGHVMSDGARLKLSAAKMGHDVSAETCAKISAKKRGKPHPHPGHPLSEIARAKLAVAGRGNKRGRGAWRGGPRVSTAKHMAKRRSLGFVPLNAPFSGSEGHHVDSEYVINMPKALHHSVYHNQYTGQGMAQINAIAYNFLFKQEVEAALGGLQS